MTRSSVVRSALGVAVVVAVSSACSFGAASTTSSGAVARAPELAPGQQVSLVFESYNLGQSGPWSDTFTTLISEFEAAHPTIHVTAQKPQGSSPNPAADAVSSVQAQLTTGTAPDVVQLGFSDMDFTVHQLRAKPLDDLVGADTVAANFDAGHPFAPAARTLAQVDGKTYGIPFVFSTPMLYLNTTLLAKAGVDPAHPPATWAEVQRDALAVRAATGKDGVYVDCVTKTAKDWCLQSVVRSDGGRVLSPDGRTLTYADGPAVDAVAMLQGLVTSGASPKLTQQQAVDAFTRGDLAMILESSSVQATFAKGAAGGGWQLSGAAIPSFDGKPAVPTNSGAALYVISDDPAKQRAAWELITFLTSDRAYTLISQKIGYLPLRTGLVENPSPMTRVNLEQLGRMEPWVSFPGNSYLQIRDGMMDAVEQVVLHGADPASTLATAQARGAALMPGGPR